MNAKGLILYCLFLLCLWVYTGCSGGAKSVTQSPLPSKDSQSFKKESVSSDPVLFSDDFNDATFTDGWPGFFVNGNYTAQQSGGKLIFSGFGTPLLNNPGPGAKSGQIGIFAPTCTDLSQPVLVEFQLDMSNTTLNTLAFIESGVRIVGTSHPNSVGDGIGVSLSRRNIAPNYCPPFFLGCVMQCPRPGPTCNPSQLEVSISHITDKLGYGIDSCVIGAPHVDFEVLTCIPLAGLHTFKVNVLPVAMDCPNVSDPSFVCSAGTVDVDGQLFPFSSAPLLTGTLQPIALRNHVTLPCDPITQPATTCDTGEDTNNTQATLDARYDNFVLSGVSVPNCPGGPGPCPVDVLTQLITLLEQAQQDVKSQDFPTSDSLAAKLGGTASALKRAKDALLEGKCKLAQNMVNAAINDLKALVHEVEAQSGKKIPASDAQDIISSLNQLISGLESLIPILCNPCP